MDCKKFSQILELSALQRNGDMESAELSDHLSRCPACKERFVKIKRHDLKIKQCMEDVEVPGDLMESIISNYRYSHQQASSRKILTLRYLPLTAAIAFIFILAYFFLGDHLLDKIEFNRVISSSLTSHDQSVVTQFTSHFSPMKINQWFDNKSGSSVRVPEFGDKAHFLGGKECKLCCQDAAYLLYGKDNKKISLFIFNIEGFDINLKRKTLEREGKTVALWRDNSFGYCMVMDSGIDDAGAILECCQPSGSNYPAQKNNCK